MNQESTSPFWGVFREVFGVRSKIWALEVSFFGIKKRALLNTFSNTLDAFDILFNLLGAEVTCNQIRFCVPPTHA